MRYILFITVSTIITFLFIDRSLALWLAHHDLGAFKIVTKLGNAALWVVPSLLLYLYFRKSSPQKAKKALYVLGSVAISGLIVDIIKPIIGRARPKELLHYHFYGFDPLTFKASFWSMPSGHSATAFSGFVALALLYPKYRYLFLALATLTALSRVLLTKHYLSDVLIGSTIGALTAIWLYKRLLHV